MKKYVKPSYMLDEIETNDIMSASNPITDNGEGSYIDENGNTVYGKEGTFSTWLDSIM